MTRQALAQGSLISCSPGRRWKGHTHKETCLASCNYGGGVPKGATLSGVSVHPAQPCSSPGRSGILPLGQIPSSPPPDQPLLCSSPFSAQRPFPGVIPSVSPSRVCPLSLVWYLQLWSPPSTHGQYHPAQVSFRTARSPAMGHIDGSTGSSHPESQDALPRSGPAQLSPFPSPHSPAYPVPPGKRLQLGEGSSIPSSAAACSGQRAQPGDVVAAGGGAVWTQAPLCPA